MVNSTKTHENTASNGISSGGKASDPVEALALDPRSAPFFLFHVTTGRKARLYRQTGQINAPVRGFDSLQGAMAWAIKVGRKVIMRVEPITTPQMLPDHHNDYGRAWWTDAVPMSRVKCAYSAEGAWSAPNDKAQPRARA